MTIASEANRAGPYLCNGVTTSFPFGFKVYDDSHVKVVLTDEDGVDTILALGADYSVSGVGDNAGGSVVTTVAHTTGSKLTILLNLSFTQGVNLENQGAFFAEVVERAFDEATQKLLQLREELTRAYRAPPSVADGVVIDPSAFEEVLGNAEAVKAYKDQAAESASAAAASVVAAGEKAEAATSQANVATAKAGEAAASAEQAALFGGLAWTPYRWTAAGGETVLAFGEVINPARVDVVKNGSTLQSNGADYSLSTTELTLTEALVAGDVVEAKVYASFAVADALQPSQNLADLSSVVSARANLGLAAGATAAKATEAQAAAGTDDTTFTTPAGVSAAIAAQAGGYTDVDYVNVSGDYTFPADLDTSLDPLVFVCGAGGGYNSNPGRYGGLAVGTVEAAPNEVVPVTVGVSVITGTAGSSSFKGLSATGGGAGGGSDGMGSGGNLVNSSVPVIRIAFGLDNIGARVLVSALASLTTAKQLAFTGPILFQNYAIITLSAPQPWVAAEGVLPGGYGNNATYRYGAGGAVIIFYRRKGG